jgi:hypothetical protein
MDMKRENKNVKQVFREEWKLFKKDSSLKKQKPEEVKFELETPQATPAKKTLEPKKREEVEDF